LAKFDLAGPHLRHGRADTASAAMAAARVKPVIARLRRGDEGRIGLFTGAWLAQARTGKAALDNASNTPAIAHPISHSARLRQKLRARHSRREGGKA
jgi:hypothetical protein